MSRRITILGMGITALRKADAIAAFVDGTEVWSMNNAYLMFPDLCGKFARFFEIHRYDYLRAWNPGTRSGQPVEHFAELDALACPIYAAGALPMVDRLKLYPFAEVLKHFGPSAEFKGTPSWMMALALYEHDKGETVTEIRSWGIDQLDAQHVCQRAAWAQWIVRAEQRGITISGTAAAFRNEPDNDAGLIGLTEYYRNELSKGE